MPSPFRKDQLSPEMVHRYGLDRRPVGSWITTGIITVAFAAAMFFVTMNLSRAPIDAQLLRWDDSAPDHLVVDFRVSRADGMAVECAVRAQDGTHIDVGYAIVPVPAGEERAHISYPLAIIAPALNAEVLGCAKPGELRVTGPQFPPGVVPPSQPYAP